MGFAENLKEIRSNRNITQEQLAEILLVSRQTISKWELGQGYPETEKLLLIAKQLNVSLDYLFSERCHMVRSVGSKRVSKIDTYLNCAEANALLNCSRQQTMGADLYLVSVNPGDNSIHKAKPCPLCARTIIQAGIRNVYLRVGEGADNYVVVPATDLKWVQEARG